MTSQVSYGTPEGHTDVPHDEADLWNGDPERQPLQHSAVESPAGKKRSVQLSLLILSIFSGAAFLVLLVDSFFWLGLSSPSADGFTVPGIYFLAALAATAGRVSSRCPARADCALSACSAILAAVGFLAMFLDRRVRAQFGTAGFLAETALLLVLILNAIACRSESLRGHITAQSSGSPSSYAPAPSIGIGARLAAFGGFVALTGVYILVFLHTSGALIDFVDSRLVPLGDLSKVSLDKSGRSSSSGAFLNLHVACTRHSAKGPLVLVESELGSAERVANWVISSKNAGTVCYFDRPGYGFSDSAPGPLSIGKTTKLMLEALNSSEPQLHSMHFGPERLKNHSVILVGHGTGGLYSQVMASHLGDSLGGMVLVDALHEDLFYRRLGALKAVWQSILGFFTALNLEKIESSLAMQSSTERVYGHWEHAQPRYHRALMQQAASSRGQSRRDLHEAKIGIPPTMPLLVISSSKAVLNREWAMYQRLLLKLSENVMAWKIVDGPHDLWRSRRASGELTELLDRFIMYREYGYRAQSHRVTDFEGLIN